MGLQPGGASLTVAGWVARTGSILFSLIMSVTRKRRDTDGLTLITWQTLGVMLAGAVSAPFAWVAPGPVDFLLLGSLGLAATVAHMCVNRSEEHTSELQSLMRISYAVFCLKKKPHKITNDASDILLTIKTSSLIQTLTTE